MKKLATFTFVALVCALIFGAGVSALVNNGDFETGAFGAWAKSTYINNGFSAPPGAGGSDLSTIEGGPAVAPLSLSDPRTNNLVRFPAYGHYSARVNSEASYSGGGFSRNANQIVQTIPAYIDPSDGKAHIKFTYAAIMVNPGSGHTPEQKPYFRVRAINTSNGNDVLYDFQSYVSEPGKNWQNGAAFNGGTEFWQYLDWTFVDLTPGAGHPVNPGDNVVVTISAAGCSLGGHPGYVYVDEITDNEIAGPTVQAVAPASVPTGGSITYTYNYRNGSTVTIDPTVAASQPAGVTFTSVSDNTNCSLSSGTVTCNYTGLAAGGTSSFTVTGNVTAASGTQIAHGTYGISATGFPSLDGQTVFTNVVNSPTTTTAVSASPNPSVFGQTVTFTANVTPNSGSGTPTGTVQFVVDGSNFGAPVTLSGGSAQISTSSLSVGPGHTVTANYSGDGSFQASSGSVAGGVTVNKADATVGISASPNPSVSGQPVTFTASVGPTAPGAGSPTGTVTFYVNGNPVCTNVPLVAATATCSPASLPPGNHTVSVTYSGDPNFNGGNGTLSGGATVNKADTTLNLTTSPNTSVTGEPVTATATVSPVAPGSGIPTGSVTFSVDGSPVCTNVALSSAQATCGLPPLGAGNHSITATYGGDTSFNGSSGSVSGGHTVSKANTSVTVTSAPNPSVSGQSVTFTATVAVIAPGVGTPTGTITFFVNGNPVCSAVAMSGLQATCSTSSLPPGNQIITATYSGDPNFNGSSGSLSGGQAVNKADTTVSVTASPATTVTGQSVTFTATVGVVAPGSGTPTGTITFFADGNPLCTAVAMSGVQAACSTASISPGNHAISATYNGDSNFNTSNGSLAGGMTVNQASTSVAVTSSNNPSVTGQSVTITANISVVAPGAGTPSGTVSFSIDGNPVCAAAAISGGQATCTVSLSAGLHPVSATYSGDSNFNSSNGSLSGGQQVDKADTSLALSASPGGAVFGQSVTFTATVSANAPGAGTPSGSVSFFADGNPVCTNAAMSGGQATCSTSSLAAGSHAITAVYGGDTDFNGSNGSLAGGFVVGKANTTTTVTTPTNPSVWGQSVTFTATVAPVAPGAGTPTGTVSFNFDGFLLCTNVVLSGAQGTCTVSSLAAGNRVVTAAYSGDDSFNVSAGTLVGGPLVVNKADSATTITNVPALGNPSHVGEAYTVSWSVSVLAPGSGDPTGTVTVSDGSVSCSAPAMAQSCNLTSNSPGVKSITAVYAGDANTNGSTAAPASHTVNVYIAGIIQQYISGGPNTDMSGVTVTLSGSANAVVTTDQSGRFMFANLSGGGSFVLTPSVGAKTFDPITRSYSNILNNIPNADFIGYDTNAVPRTLTAVNQYVTPGDDIIMPLELESRGNEAGMTFSLAYPYSPLKWDSITCGDDAPNCSVTADASEPGKVAVTFALANPLSAGTRQIIKLKFRTHATVTLSNAMITFTDDPLVKYTTDAESNPLPTGYSDGAVIFAQGLESDVGGRYTGDGELQSNDVTLVRQLVVGLIAPDPMYNEFQRADAAPAGTKGDGMLDATDIIQARRFTVGLDGVVAPGGPFRPGAQPQGNAPARTAVAERSLRVGSASTWAGSKLTLPVELSANGDEAALSFSLDFDPMKLSNPEVSLADGFGSDVALTVNTAKPGRLTVLVDSNGTLTSGKEKGVQFLNLTFDVAAKAASGDTFISFAADPAPPIFSDSGAKRLDGDFGNGTVSITGPNAAGVAISGRVLTPDGRGLRNADVTLIDSSGIERTVKTGSFGYYRFDGVAVDGFFTVRVSSRRFKFETRRVTVNGELADVDLFGKE